MNLFNKQVATTPEMELAKATTFVDSQKAQFETMVLEIEVAQDIRVRAIAELDKEADSLEAQARAKRAEVNRAIDAMEADEAYKARLNELLGAN